MAEQQLIDYIKKAKEAGQSDDLTRNLLYKNGWTEAEVSAAFLSTAQPQVQEKPQPLQVSQQKPQTQTRSQSQVQEKPQPQPQPQISKSFESILQSNAGQTKPKSHTLSKILISSIVVVILGGIAFVAGQYSGFFNNIFEPNPNAVLSSMVEGMKGVKSYRTSFQISASVVDNESKEPQGTLTFGINGDLDSTDVNSQKADINFNLNLKMPGSNQPISLNAETVAIGGVSFVKLSKINIPEEFSVQGLDLSKVKGVWFKIDQETTDILSRSGAIQMGAVNVQQLNNLGLIQKLQNSFPTQNIFSVKEQLEDEIIGEKETYHYSLILPKDKVKALVSNPNIAVQNMNTFVDAVGDINLEVWIGKEDSMLYKYSINKIVDLSRTGIPMTLEVKINETNSNFNKPITAFQEPTKFQKAEEVLLPVIKVQKIVSDIKTIDNIAKFLFTKSESYKNLCYGNLLNGYLEDQGENLINLNNDIMAQGGKKPVCLSAVQDYCISTQLEDGNYVCVDDLGIIGKTKCLSAQTACK